jgi:hypothetical protein
VAIALAGTRGIANAAVAEAASATAMKPAWKNRFIEYLLHRTVRQLAQVPGEHFVPGVARPFRFRKKRQQFPESNRNCRFFPNCGQAFRSIFRSEEPFFRSVICQAVMMTRWEQNK